MRADSVEDGARAPVRSSASFRDPDGFIFRRDGLIHRQVQPSARADYDRLMHSGLYEELTRAGLLIEHEEVELACAYSPGAYKVLRPAQLDFVSYPYEWCFSQLQDAALATLAIQKRALVRGMSLKDATAYNVQFHRGRALWIDTLSFECLREGEAWVAYRQFCQHFLAPLALESLTHTRLSQLLRVHLDGVPLDLAGRLLPWRSVFTLSLGLHVHAHARAQSKYAQTKPAPREPKGRFTLRNFQALIESLETAVSKLELRIGKTEWADYYQANNNYGAQGLDAKRAAVRKLLGTSRPASVWDLGANTGMFTRLALECGARHAIAWDIDPACVEMNYLASKKAHETALLPLHLDLTNPSPALGWAHAERMSLAERGPADVVLALGLIHHIAISNNVPLEHIARYLARLARVLVIEWVPKEDSQVERLLATRRDVFPDYTQAGFEREFARAFRIDEALPIEGTRRTLYRMQALDR